MTYIRGGFWDKSPPQNLTKVFCFFSFFGFGEITNFYSTLWRFVSWSYWKHHVSSSVTIDSKNIFLPQTVSMRSRQWSTLTSFWWSNNARGTKRAHAFRFFEYLVEIARIVSLPTLNSCACNLMLTFASVAIFWRTFSIVSGV